MMSLFRGIDATKNRQGVLLKVESCMERWVKILSGMTFFWLNICRRISPDPRNTQIHLLES